VSRSSPSASGGYQLMAYPDCTRLHTGKYVGLTIFAVARNTTDERLFKRTELAEASVYAKSVFGQIEAIATAELCDQAVIDTYERPTLVSPEDA
jgi:hypothetical protein